jgi:hypothetical protein
MISNLRIIIRLKKYSCRGVDRMEAKFDLKKLKERTRDRKCGL